MPSSDRKYAKQHLDRASNHVLDVMTYCKTVGEMFIEQGKLISADSGQWPEEYIRIIETVDALMTGLDVTKSVIDNLRDSF